MTLAIITDGDTDKIDIKIPETSVIKNKAWHLISGFIAS